MRFQIHLLEIFDTMAPYPTNPKSPFFAPGQQPPPRQSGGGTDGSTKEDEPSSRHRTTISGATANQINAVIGAGIVGIPYAIQQTGLLAGMLLLMTCAAMTEKSLRLLIIAAKHVDVATYERLFESAYGSIGFYFIVTNMIVMAYGGCLTYLMIIRDTLPVLLGVNSDDVTTQRIVLLGSTLLVLLPISMQRVSVFNNCPCIVFLCVYALVSFLCVYYRTHTHISSSNNTYLLQYNNAHPYTHTPKQQNEKNRIWQHWRNFPNSRYCRRHPWYC